MKEFLRRLPTRFQAWLGKLLTGEPRKSPRREALSGDERITRFLYSRSQYSTKANKPKPSAFNPAPYEELSTAHITGLANEPIWQLSRDALGDQPGRDKIYARGDIDVIEVINRSLTALRDNDPFERHTVIVGWPQVDEVADRKEQWAQIALELSQEATLHISHRPITHE